ncbi:MAG: NAD(P)-dependent alcohol dehydrogenase, partial [Saprospiraceae bacterium]|nr:NAD(P)-dependent alcohol dehydrogenase [Saprospiraceae bacterium]
MKTIVYPRYGSPDLLRMENTPTPIPGDDEVLVKVHAVSLNSWDWDMLTGRPFEYRFISGFFKPKSSKLHGCDIAGIIESTGKNVTRFKVGDEVFGDLSEDGWGAYAEYVCAGENELTRKPLTMTFEQAACMAHGGNLAVQGLMDCGKIKSGQKVLINGGGGSTGTLAVQLAKTFDVDLTAVDHTVKLDMMRSLGADHVIDYMKDDFTDNGIAYDLIFDVKTDRAVSDYQNSLRPNGTYVTVGGKTSRILQVLLFVKFSQKYKMKIVGYEANKDSEYLIELFETNKLK